MRTRAPSLLTGIAQEAAHRAVYGSWWSGVLLAAVVAVVWFGLAATHPTTTYHIAPPRLVAPAWPVGRRSRTGTALTATRTLTATAGGTAIALAATLALALRHALAGPTLVGSGGAMAETLIAIVLGAVLGGLLASWHRHQGPAATRSSPSTVDSTAATDSAEE